MELTSGTLLERGKYLIISTLGRGGFGITYLAEQTMAKRRVCVKEFFPKDFFKRDEGADTISLLSQSHAGTMSRFKEKFIKEAQTIAALDHPNIIHILDVFEENNTAYYVMEYVEGGSLSDVVKRGGNVAEGVAIKYIRDIASALGYIHCQKINHLDVKPGNILLRPKEDQTILIDFGLAKHYDAGGEQTSSTPVGISHGYAPIEQYKSGGVSSFSPATDIYGLGATLYYLVTGTVPPSATDMGREGVEVPSNLSPGVQRAIKEAMNYWREERPQSIDDFLKLLDNEPEVVAPVAENTIIDVEPKHDDESTIISVEPTQTAQPAPQPKNEPKPKNKRKSKKGLWLGIFLFILAAVASFILFGGGSKEKEDAPKSAVATVDTPQLNESPKQKELKPELIVESESEVILPYDGGSGEIKYSVKNDDGVSEVSCANSGDSWLTTTIDIDVIHYSAKKNTTGSERSATIKVIYGNQSFEVVVTQPAAPVGFTLNSSDSIKLSADGGSAKIKYTITNPVDGESVKYATDAEWLTLKPNDGVVSCTAQANTIGKDRNATVTLTYCGQSVEVNIYQYLLPFNEIWYTSSDGKVVKPYNGGKNIFGAVIESNTYKDGKGILKFKDDVTTIGEWAFEHCYSLKSITIPNSVTTIGDSAFYHCESLNSVTIPDSVTTIGEHAFAHCDNLTSVTIPNSVKTIGEAAFSDCRNLKEFRGGSTFINGRCLIINCKLVAFAPAGITKFTIPNSVTTIGELAFWGCSSLTSVTIPNSVTTIGELSFSFCDNLTSVTIPNSVMTIGNYAFNGCESLKSVTIPNSVTTIENCAFQNCKSLTSVTIPNSVTTIGERTFNGCESLKSVTIPDSVTTIGEWAFYGCGSLTSVTIPDSVTTIGEHAFYLCESLKSVTIPNSVTSIGAGAFACCRNLKEFKGGSAFINGRCLIINGKLVAFAPAGITEYTIPNSVTTIGDYAFAYCNNLTSVTIPNSVRTIAASAFRGCKSLKSVTIPNNVTTIEDYAFYECKNLSEETRKRIKSINP